LVYIDISQKEAQLLLKTFLRQIAFLMNYFFYLEAVQKLLAQNLMDHNSLSNKEVLRILEKDSSELDSQ